MRDKERIQRILDLIKKYWEKLPDQRFGQFLLNYVFGKKHSSYIFYLEDDIIEDRLHKLGNTMTNGFLIVTKVINDIRNNGEEIPSLELELKCPLCRSNLFCNIHKDRMIYVCGKYNCGFRKSFEHNNLLESPLGKLEK